MKAKGTFLVPTCMAGEWTGGKLERFPPAIAAKAKAAFAAHDEMFRRAVKMRRQDRVRHGLRRFRRTA